jgi:hypothetical protein
MLDNSRRTISEGVPADPADDNLIRSVIDEEIGHIRKVIGNEDTSLQQSQEIPRKITYVTVDASRTRLLRSMTHSPLH